MKPRFLFVDHTAVPGGAEKFLLDIVDSIHWEGQVLLFEDGPFAEELSAAGVPPAIAAMNHRLAHIGRDSHSAAAVRALPALWKLARITAEHARGADLIYANSQKSMIVSAIAGRLSRRPVVWHLHDLLTPDHFSASHIRAAVWASRGGVRRVIANSEATRDAFVEAGGRAEACFVVPNGFRPDDFQAIPASEIAQLRSDVGLDGRPVVGVFSRIAEWKGQHVLLEAAGSLPDVQVMIVGDALFRGDAPYRERLHELAAGDGLRGRVHFLGHRSDVARLIQVCAAVAHTSCSPEPFGRVIVEGMLSGVPVVATDAGGAAEIIQDGVDGLRVPAGDPEALCQALREILTAPDYSRRLGTAARRSAAERFSLNHVVGRIAELTAPILMMDSAAG